MYLCCSNGIITESVFYSKIQKEMYCCCNSSMCLVPGTSTLHARSFGKTGHAVIKCLFSSQNHYPILVRTYEAVTLRQVVWFVFK